MGLAQGRGTLLGPEEGKLATPTDNQPRYLYGTEAASRARVHHSTLYRWIREGRVRANKVGGRWYVSCDDLDGLLAGEPR